MKLLKIISKFFKNQSYGNNTVRMLIGSENTLLTAYSTKGFSRTTHIPNKDPEFFGKYRSFLNQFKGWDIVLLLDNENIKIQKEELPTLYPMIKMKDRAKNFIFSSVDDHAIVAYSKSNMKTEAGVNVENIIFAYTVPSVQLIDIISFIYNFNFPLVGIYILTMEMNEIIRDMCNNIDLDIKDKFIIFAIPTLVSGIRVFAIDRGKIYSSKIVPYPNGKSLEYIAGVIEQSVSDVLEKHKKYITSNQLAVEVVLCTSPACAKIIAKHEIESNVHSISWGEQKQNLAFANLGDEVLVYNLRLKHPASNKHLRQVYAMEKFNNSVLNLVMAGVIAIFVYAGIIEYKILRTESNISKLNQEYYKISALYREARQKLESMSNLPDIYDIISDIAILKASSPKAFESLKSVIDIQDKRANISDMIWKLTQENVGAMQSELVLNIKYEDKSIQLSELQKDLAEYEIRLSKIFPNYKIESIEDKQNIVNLPSKVMIPKKFTITGPISDE